MNHDQFSKLVKALPGEAFDAVTGWGIKETDYDGEHGQMYIVDGHKPDGEPWQMMAFVPTGSTETVKAVTLMLQKIVKKETN